MADVRVTRRSESRQCVHHGGKSSLHLKTDYKGKQRWNQSGCTLFARTKTIRHFRPESDMMGGAWKLVSRTAFHVDEPRDSACTQRFVARYLGTIEVPTGVCRRISLHRELTLPYHWYIYPSLSLFHPPRPSWTLCVTPLTRPDFDSILMRSPAAANSSFVPAPARASRSCIAILF